MTVYKPHRNRQNIKDEQEEDGVGGRRERDRKARQLNASNPQNNNKTKEEGLEKDGLAI